MSRVAKNPITIPSGVNVNINGHQVSVKGSAGEMSIDLHKSVTIAQYGEQLFFSTQAFKTDPREGSAKVQRVGKMGKLERLAWAQAGTARANVNNCIVGVVDQFEKKLKLVGVGYRANVKGKAVELLLGYSHPISYKIPADIVITTPSQTEISIKGKDKQKVGQVAAEIRAYRPPEPYKGKGICYSDEQIIRKETKKK